MVNIQNDWKLQISQGYIIRILQHFATKLWNITNFVMLFQTVMKFCLDLLRSKFWLIGEWSIPYFKTTVNSISSNMWASQTQTQNQIQ
jgi:valyl-tRNA synthetase